MPWDCADPAATSLGVPSTSTRPIAEFCATALCSAACIREVTAGAGLFCLPETANTTGRAFVQTGGIAAGPRTFPGVLGPEWELAHAASRVTAAMAARAGRSTRVLLVSSMERSSPGQGVTVDLDRYSRADQQGQPVPVSA